MLLYCETGGHYTDETYSIAQFFLSYNFVLILRIRISFIPENSSIQIICFHKLHRFHHVIMQKTIGLIE